MNAVKSSFCILYRKDHGTSDGNTAIGKPQSGTLSQGEKALLEEEGIAVPSTEVMFYPSLLLTTNSTITARTKSRVTKRDNSCLLYIDSVQSTCWGVLQKIFAFRNNIAHGYYCVITMLSPAFAQLCTDQVTR